jgi:hypothetical protein
MSSFKECKYGCAIQIQWDTELNAFREFDGRLHDRKRCESLRPTNANQVQQQQQQKQQQNPLQKPSEESVQRGISAFTMMTDLIGLVEQTQKLLVTMNGKLDRLLNLVELDKK